MREESEDKIEELLKQNNELANRLKDRPEVAAIRMPIEIEDSDIEVKDVSEN